ncbi:MAG: O-antigen ligase family protein [Planctomycetota bacterium]|nr:O-antigen ligase family protein [Planctomycetota bacterium]
MNKAAHFESGKISKLLFGIIALSLGVAIGIFVGADGMHGHRLEVEWLGPSPPLLNDFPQIGSFLLTSFFSAIAFFFAWGVRSGSADKPLAGLLALSLFSDAIPAIYQLAVLLILAVLLERFLRGHDFSVPLSPSLLPIGAVLVVYLTTFLSAPNPTAVLIDYIFRLLVLLMVILLPVILGQRKHLETFLKYLLAAACLSALVGLSQLVLSMTSGRILTFASADFNKIEFPVPILGSSVLPRCTGLMLHPNHQANALGTIALLSLWLGLGPKVARSQRMIYLSSFMLLAVGVFVTFSRSGWLALGIGAMVLPFFRWPKYRIPYSLVVLAGAVFGFKTGLFSMVYEIVENMNAASADFRWHIDALAVEAFLTSPWFGVGVGGILNFFNPYHLEIHNTYLQILAEMGLAGVLGFGALFVILAFRIRRAISLAQRNPDKSGWSQEWLVGLAIASSMLLLQNLVAMFLWVKFLWAWIAFIEASIFVSLRRSRQQAHPDPVFLQDEV